MMEKQMIFRFINGEYPSLPKDDLALVSLKLSHKFTTISKEELLVLKIFN